MTNNEWTPSEKKIKEELHRLYSNDSRKPSGTLNLSFTKAENTAGKIINYHRFKKIVACLLLTIFASLCINNFSTYASALQKSTEKNVFIIKDNIIFAEKDKNYVMTNGEINDFATVYKVKELVTDLPVPIYVPERFKFEHFLLDCYDSGFFHGEYTYIAQNQKLNFSFTSLNRETSTMINNYYNVIELNDRTITIWKDSALKTEGFSIVFDNYIFQLKTKQNILTRDEMIQIAKNVDL